jgi:predicted glycosyltransferase
MDYEHQPANHLAFRLASRVIVPKAFPAPELKKYGASLRKVKRYDGLKEDVYLADFTPNPSFNKTLRDLGVASEDVLIVARPPASGALYHRFENELFDELLAHLNGQKGAKVILLPRTNAQRTEYEKKNLPNVIMPREALDGANLIAAADLVVSAGGTMNREAAALGVPAASIYAGKWAAIDEQLAREGRLQKLTSANEFESLPLQKKSGRGPRLNPETRAEVANLILDES